MPIICYLTLKADRQKKGLFMKKKGFDRLRGMVVAGAIGVAGFAGGVTARAAATATGLSVTRGNVVWSVIGNNTSFPSSSTMTTTNGAVYTIGTSSSSSSRPPAFGIADAILSASSSSSGYGDAFDNALLLAVDGNLFVNPTGTMDLTGDTVTSEVVTDIVAGIDAQIAYYFVPTRPVVRALFSLTNTTGAPITIDPVVLSDYGSDTSTRTSATSSGDTTIDNADLWYITDEGSSGDDPRIMTSRYGEGAAVVPTNALTPSDTSPMIAVSGLRYNTTVAPGSTVRIMVFMELSDPDDAEIPNAIASAQDYTSLSTLDAAGLLNGITSDQQNEIINYVAVAAAPPAAVAVPLMPIGLLALLGLFGGAGFFELRRRKI